MTSEEQRQQEENVMRAEIGGVFFDYVLAVTLKNEGGLLEERKAAKVGDPGGETYKGITAATLKRLKIKKAPRELTDDEVREIYRVNYWALKGGPREIVPVSPAVALAVFDAGVQHSPRRAIRWLQKVVRAKQDGHVGEKTRDALRWCGEGAAIIRFHEQRRLHLTRWVQLNVIRLPLLTGLISRVDLMERTALLALVDEVGYYRKLGEEFKGVILSREI